MKTMKDYEDLYDKLSPLVKKRVIVGGIDLLNKYKEEDEILDATYRKRKGQEVVLILPDFAIIHQFNNPTFEDAPYKVVIRNEAEWKETSTCYKSLDQALLGGLEYKYLGLNSQFTQFATKMLEMESEK